MIDKIRKFKIVLLALAVFAMVVLPTTVFAQAAERSVELGYIENAVVTGVQAIIQIIVGTLGKLTLQLIHILIMVAGYNNFMDSPTITTGWVIARDVANLFFVAIILVVSIRTIVSPTNFGGPKQIFKILFFALLVNFSRTIASLFIDISQLVMLTFVNGFAAAAGGNFVEALGITKLVDVTVSNSPLTFSARMGGLILALVMFVIITVIIASMVVILVVRMVTLWMLVVLAPIAFALGAYTGTHAHYSKWWEKFSKELTTGPIIAFFLWLSLVSFQGSTGSDITGVKLQENSTASNEVVSVSCGETVACSEESMIRFIVAVVMLLSGLTFASEFGGLGGSIAKSALASGKKYAGNAARFAARKAALPVAAVATGGIGLAAGGAYLASRTRFGQQATNKAKSFAGKTLGGGNVVGNVLGRIPGVGALGRGITMNASKQREEMMKDVRAKTAGLNDQQRTILFKSPTQPQIVKDVIATDISKNKSFSNAKFDVPQERERYDQFVEAYKTLDAAGKSGDKDSRERAKEIADTRPDIVAAATGNVTDLTNPAKLGKLDELKKINFEKMGKDKRNTFFAAMDDKTLNEYYEKGSNSQEKTFIDEFRTGTAKTGADLKALVASGADISSESVTKYDSANKKQEPNIELAVEVVVNGNDAQLKQLKNNKNVDKLATGMKEDTEKKIDYSKPGLGGGFNAANTHLSDENLRKTEAIQILGGDTSQIFGVRNGNFTDKRGQNSFAESLRTTPKRVEFILSQDHKNISGAKGGNEITTSILNSLRPNELTQLAATAKTQDQIMVVEKLVKAADKMWRNVPDNAGISATSKLHYSNIANEALYDDRLERMSRN